ncbi:type II secretion system protein J [uncultured Microbacterium sp.]|uniref:PulJ/GspJ family protein n=1 Tax=uncultured Microbacterium sp. TaxID=191216 RepID=UPI0026002053|nr:hypothetical protein [uncultured Microbacterium sp.]
MSETNITDDNEGGFTLIDMVVTMVIGGLLTIMTFNLLNIAREVSEIVAEPVTTTIATQTAMNSLGKAVRNSPDQRVTDDGTALYLLNQENEYTVWHMSEEGLTNGLRKFEDVKEARFEQADGVIRVALVAADGHETEQTIASRFPVASPSERVFTDSFLKKHAPTE